MRCLNGSLRGRSFFLPNARRVFYVASPLLFLVFVVTVQPDVFGQPGDGSFPAAANILGPHNVGGRGCSGCHTAHSDSSAAAKDAATASPDTGNGGGALWGQGAGPTYGTTILVGESENYVEASPERYRSASEEVVGVLLCLSCHDGNFTKQTMMPSQSYTRRMGFLGSGDRTPIPTLLGDGSLVSEYQMDHPLGPDATITLTDGLNFTNGVFSVAPNSPYARFMENYGLPLLAPGTRKVPYGINQTGQPYLLCTTCHNQHVMSSYTSTPTSQIAGDGGGNDYTTYFFINGPYNPKFDNAPGTRAPSMAQFCRQCHIDLANEGNNSLNVRTAFFR